ncbi:MAG: XRE family transcriptional regulator [Desulfobacteraceae bacterium]|nr:XRE family transcriptional regulator [Desulfobacteraceae bacterium]MBC2755017.1 XRE family transcriptional regulator [Desulfobacteraceae bacterium]
MDFYSMTDRGIGVELGNRVRSQRLRRDRTQQQVADAAALSLNAVKSVESGKGKLLTLIAVLRELGALDALDSFIPEPAISPMQLVRQQGKKRQRASGRRLKRDLPENEQW